MNEIPEHVVEDRLAEGIEVGQDLAALGAEGVGLIEDRRDPPLLSEGRSGNGDLAKELEVPRIAHTRYLAEPQVVINVFRIKSISHTEDLDSVGTHCEGKVDVLQGARVIAKDYERTNCLNARRRVIRVPSDKGLALVDDG